MNYKYGYELTIAGKAVIENDILWMVSIHNDMLMKYDWSTKRINRYYQIPGKSSEDYSHWSISIINDLIYVFPLYGSGIYVFDVNKEQFQEIHFDKYESAKKLSVSISEVISDRVIFFDRNSNNVYAIHVGTNEIEQIDMDLKKTLEKKGFDISKPHFSWKYCRLDDNIYIPVEDTNTFVCFDLNTYNALIYELESENDICSLSCTYDHVVFTTKGNGRIIWKEGKEIDKKDSKTESNGQ